MKLTSLTIEHFRQFKDFQLDFTDPKTGEPLEKVCLIGPNGTGKSTLLRIISWQAWGEATDAPKIPGGSIELATQSIVASHMPTSKPVCSWVGGTSLADLPVVWCPADADRPNALGFLQSAAALRTALGVELGKVVKQTVSLDESESFWTRLVAHIKKREQHYLEFQARADHQSKTVAEIRSQFDAVNPKALDDLNKVWDGILRLADLEFDLESAEVPIQLTDNFRAYIRTRSRKARVPYDQLSTGIRHYIFRLGHIWSLYFNRPPGDSILLVDEPEGSLYPDFLYDIVENYREVAPGCQLFMATHSPIVASQFKPEERFILNFGDDGYVIARRGTSPEGDDPNDILRQDFGVGSLMPEAGERAWERFLHLRRLIPATVEAEREPLIDECLRLQRDYNFPLPYGGAPNGKHA